MPYKETDKFIFMTNAAKGAWEAANDLGLVIVLMPLGSAQTAVIQVAEWQTVIPM